MVLGGPNCPRKYIWWSTVPPKIELNKTKDHYIQIESTHLKNMEIPKNAHEQTMGLVWLQSSQLKRRAIW